MALASRVRHELARRRWLYRTLVVALAGVTWWTAAAWAERVETQRASWGSTVEVWVATRDVSTGQLLIDAVERRTFPAATVPPAAVRDLDAVTAARRPVPSGAVVTRLDVAADSAPASLLDEGEVGVAVIERVPSGARTGDRVMVVADGLVLAGDATVVGASDDRVVVAVPVDGAPAVAAAAAGANGVGLLLQP